MVRPLGSRAGKRTGSSLAKHQRFQTQVWRTGAQSGADSRLRVRRYGLQPLPGYQCPEEAFQAGDLIALLRKMGFAPVNCGLYGALFRVITPLLKPRADAILRPMKVMRSISALEHPTKNRLPRRTVTGTAFMVPPCWVLPMSERKRGEIK